MMATRAAKTGVNGKDDAWARIIDRANNPFPRMRFSPNSSGTTCLMFDTLTCHKQSIAITTTASGKRAGRTLLIIPFILLRRASQLKR